MTQEVTQSGLVEGGSRCEGPSLVFGPLTEPLNHRKSTISANCVLRHILVFKHHP